MPVKEVIKHVYAAAFPHAFKRRAELRYWKGRRIAQGGALPNDHYEGLYTKVYGLTREDFVGKRLLDIGCGPRGSLEWADMTAQRVGLDPLVADYMKLGADKHKMQYVASGSERIPFADGHFDIVACLNALDHVDELDATVREIKRVTKRGGMLLLSVETDHPPSPTEPITITDRELAKLAPEFQPIAQFRVGSPPDHNLHRAVIDRSPEHVVGQPGIHVASYRRA